MGKSEEKCIYYHTALQLKQETGLDAATEHVINLEVPVLNPKANAVQPTLLLPAFNNCTSS